MTLKEHAAPLWADCDAELTTNIVVCRKVDVSRFGRKGSCVRREQVLHLGHERTIQGQLAVHLHGACCLGGRCHGHRHGLLHIGQCHGEVSAGRLGLAVEMASTRSISASNGSTTVSSGVALAPWGATKTSGPWWCPRAWRAQRHGADRLQRRSGRDEPIHTHDEGMEFEVIRPRS